MDIDVIVKHSVYWSINKKGIRYQGGLGLIVSVFLPHMHSLGEVLQLFVSERDIVSGMVYISPPARYSIELVLSLSG